VISKLIKRLINQITRSRASILGAKQIQRLLHGAKSLEIGGPSKIFSDDGTLPTYNAVSSLDNCNYSNETVWKKSSNSDPKLKEIHKTLNIENHFIFEADDLSGIAASTYDAVLSSHVLEHVANPIKALKEWRRVLKPNGILVLVIPNKDGSFDHLRPVTTMSHLIADYKNSVGPEDLTHLPEVLRLHDMTMDKDAGTVKEFTDRCKNNLINRCIHHHVFDQELAQNIVNFAEFQLLNSEVRWNCHIIIIARKLAD